MTVLHRAGKILPGWPHLSCPLKHSFELFLSKFHKDRAAVGALCGKINLVQLVKKRAYLLLLQFSTGTDYAMAGDGHQTLLYFLPEHSGLSNFGELCHHLSQDRKSVV